jgi:potassium-transporting ATPase KdpC subunit
MKNLNLVNTIFSHLLTSARMVLLTMGICSGLYMALILGFAQLTTPHTADGSLITDSRGNIIGSRLIAQNFSRPEYFRPRPSAVNYNAAAAGGSNLSPANPALRARAEEIIAKMDAGNGRLVPADLVSASGSGLDPYITEHAAVFQADRVAHARGIALDRVMGAIKTQARKPGGVLNNTPLVNVLELNLAVDKLTHDKN